MDNMFLTRIDELCDLGMTVNIHYQSYVFKDVNVGFVEIQTLSDEEWFLLINKITPILKDRQLANINNDVSSDETNLWL